LIYLIGMGWIQRNQWRLTLYVWSAFGLAFLVIHLALLMGWPTALAAAEAQHLVEIMRLLGFELEVVNEVTIMVPDSTGWSGLTIGIESSTLIELSAFVGLMLYYPRISTQRRSTYLMIGIIGTYLFNLIRLVTIVTIILVWGKSAFPLAHNVIGRLVYFAGVVGLYWYLFVGVLVVISLREYLKSP